MCQLSDLILKSDSLSATSLRCRMQYHDKLNCVITDSTWLYNARPSEGTVLATKLDMLFSNFLSSLHIDGLVQHCSNSSELAMELLQSCIKAWIWAMELYRFWENWLCYAMFVLASELLSSQGIKSFATDYKYEYYSIYLWLISTFFIISYLWYFSVGVILFFIDILHSFTSSMCFKMRTIPQENLFVALVILRLIMISRYLTKKYFLWCDLLNFVWF